MHVVRWRDSSMFTRASCPRYGQAPQMLRPGGWARFFVAPRCQSSTSVRPSHSPMFRTSIGDPAHDALWEALVILIALRVR
eukprot:13425557-Alexandrium_andersonii.AAC.1